MDKIGGNETMFVVTGRNNPLSSLTLPNSIKAIFNIEHVSTFIMSNEHRIITTHGIS